MSMDKLHKTLSKGATGYLLFPLASKDTNAQPLPPEIAAVLQKFADIFEEPTTLPPERECDHTIPLKEGSIPPDKCLTNKRQKWKSKLRNYWKHLLFNPARVLMLLQLF
jgi:hypothetical protein